MLLNEMCQNLRLYGTQLKYYAFVGNKVKTPQPRSYYTGIIISLLASFCTWPEFLHKLKGVQVISSPGNAHHIHNFTILITDTSEELIYLICLVFRLLVFLQDVIRIFIWVLHDSKDSMCSFLQNSLSRHALATSILAFA